MKTLSRVVVLVGFYALAAIAGAQDSGSWGTSRYVRLGDDRVVVFSHGATFDLQRDANWDIADAAQKKRFESWVKASGLPKDPSQFVADLPASRQVALSGEILVGAPSEAGATLSLKLGTGTPERISVIHTAHWGIAPADRGAFEAFAHTLHASLPTLLVALSGATEPTEEQAWQRIVERAGAPGGFVTLLGGSKEALWTHRGEGLPAPAAPAAKLSARAAATQAGGTPGWVLFAFGGGVVAIGGILLAVPGVRTRVLGAVGKPASGGTATFPVGSHERELILKVREEGRRKPPPPNAPYSEEEYAVGMMLDRYAGYDTLSQELERARKQADALKAYKEYQEQYDEFEKRYSDATASLAQRDADLAKMQTAGKDLQEKLRQADTYVKKLQQEQKELLQALAEADALLAETGEWCKAVTDRLNAQATKIHHE